MALIPVAALGRLSQLAVLFAGLGRKQYPQCIYAERGAEWHVDQSQEAQNQRGCACPQPPMLQPPAYAEEKGRQARYTKPHNAQHERSQHFWTFQLDRPA